jgi:UDP-glucose 4-epimerase
MDTAYWSGRRVLVLGGTGFIGSLLVEQLIRQGAKVTVLYRQALAWLEPLKGQLQSISLLDPQAKQLLQLRAPEVVFHAASFRKNGQYHRQHSLEVCEANTQITQILLELLPNCVEQMVFFSTANIPAQITHQVALPEILDGYVRGKALSERLMFAAAQEHKWSFVCMRIANAYGPRDYIAADGNVIPALLWRLAQGETPLCVQAPAELARPFIFVDDVVQSALLLASRITERSSSVLTYVYPPQTHTLQSLVAILQTALDTHIPVQYAAESIQPTQLAYGSCHPLLGTLRWTPLPLGIAKTVAWWRSMA